jgi:hypothetical protein
MDDFSEQLLSNGCPQVARCALGVACCFQVGVDVFDEVDDAPLLADGREQDGEVGEKVLLPSHSRSCCPNTLRRHCVPDGWLLEHESEERDV